MPRKLKTVKTAVAAKAKRRRLTQAERTGISDARMYAATMKLIGEVGTHNLKLKEVSRIAGYSRSLASARFGTKDALLAAVISTWSQRWQAGLTESIGNKKGVAALRAWADGLADLLERNPGELRALYIVCYETIGSSEATRKYVAQTHFFHRTRLERWISDGISDGSIDGRVSPRDAALHFVSMFYGLIYQWLVEPEVIDIVGVLRNIEFDFSKR
jgi:AcrR family transcriptional regulator